MKIIGHFLLCSIITLSSLATDKSSLCYLQNSMYTMDTLIKNNEVSLVLQNGQEYDMNLLRQNYSSAVIVLEIEILNQSLPTLVYFYKGQSADTLHLLLLLSKYAEVYGDKIKLVAVDIEQMPSMVAPFDLHSLPAISVIKNRNEILFIDDNITPEVLHTIIMDLIK